MGKRFKNGLIVMKGYPVHKGHLYLIDTASENCDVLNVILSHNERQTIPGEVRYNWLKEIYQHNDNINVFHFDDGDMPQYDYECETLDEFYSYWVPKIYSIVSDLDVVFSSENYGDDFARYLGVEHFLVDKERVTIPISGTSIRDDVFANWDYLPDEVKPYFNKRIVLMGPESVGKSTLTKDLANHFKTNYVEEYGRFVYEMNGNSITKDDFIPISEGRQDIEDYEITMSNKYLFCDTEDITTYLFLKMYCTDYEKEEKWFLNTLKNKSNYDLYILLTPDCPGVQDGTRNFLEGRENHYNVIKNELISRNCNFIEVSGGWKERFDKVVNHIQNAF
jgi:HTH-type transcriptional repressor of NAD biosynthesis genes